jgi:phosphoenolpyruvate synthase/pyruvate phosphate dikinase
MAVVVQKLVPAEVAGVLFTRDPLDPDGMRMLTEASWGLGEAVVSGRVTPDRFHLDRHSGVLLDKQLGSKAIRITAAGEEHVPPDLQQQFCLSDTALSQLADLGRNVEAFYGDPRDVEWAYAGGAFHLLQARPITVATAAEREQVRQAIVADADDMGGGAAVARGGRRVRRDEPRPRRETRPGTRVTIGIRPRRRPTDDESVALAADAVRRPADRVSVRRAQG